MLSKLKMGIGFAFFVTLPQTLAARSPLPFALVMCGLFVFIAMWLIRSRLQKDDGEPDRKIMGTDRIGIAILAAMGGFFILFRVAAAYGGQLASLAMIPAMVVVALIGLIVKSVIDARRRQAAAEADQPPSP
jgi:hypothetical protein